MTKNIIMIKYIFQSTAWTFFH